MRLEGRERLDLGAGARAGGGLGRCIRRLGDVGALPAAIETPTWRAVGTREEVEEQVVKLDGKNKK